jgi:hypothetical protein
MLFTASAYELWKPSAGNSIPSIVPFNDLPIAINASVAAPGYKDQAAPFPAGSDVHFYLIKGFGLDLTGVSSLNPPSVGPNIGAGHLAGYDSYCYLTTIKIDPYGGLAKSEVRGKQVYFREISHYPVFLVNPDRFPPAEPPGHALVTTPINVRPAVPEIALTFTAYIDAQIAIKGTTSAYSAVLLQIKEGETYANPSCFAAGHVDPVPPRLKANAQDYDLDFPNPDNGLIYYRWEDIDPASGASRDILERYLSVFMRGYTLP